MDIVVLRMRAFSRDHSGLHSSRFLGSGEDICMEERKWWMPHEAAVTDWPVDIDEAPFGGSLKQIRDTLNKFIVWE